MMDELERTIIEMHNVTLGLISEIENTKTQVDISTSTKRKGDLNRYLTKLKRTRKKCIELQALYFNLLDEIKKLTKGKNAVYRQGVEDASVAVGKVFLKEIEYLLSERAPNALQKLKELQK